ncbi:aldo/keto reductase [Phyllobacterium sp. UNC302MFCol5.2]|uniref:aldo/keto reductase n=1 Tax=Phyllobacterium sp. UNC302MFCol5.2 TaxID=1449065 RepID=UPI00047FA254|nr:aldo/keto reductase [Phyllobacterium sp. UNC302MFCol5.2]
MPETSLPSRPVGKTSLCLSVYGFGAAPLGGIYKSLSDAEAAATVEAALAAGVTYFDVAPFYGMGLAEHRLGTALRKRRADTMLSTKVGRLLKPVCDLKQESMYVDPLDFEVIYDYSYDGVMRSIEDSYQRLGLPAIDIVYIHDVNRKWHGDQVDQRFSEVMNGGYRALEKLRSAGIIKAIGVGVNDNEILIRFAEAGDFDCFMLAGRYTLLEQSPLDELFPLCEQKGISIISAAPFNSGILATGAKAGAKYFYMDAPQDVLDRTRRIEAVCDRHHVPLAAAALQFALGHPVVSSVAAGSSSPAEVKANVAMTITPIPADFWAELKSEGLIRADTPVYTR